MPASFTPGDQDKLANTLLIVIEELVAELHANKTRSFVLSLDSSLDDDIGLDSLARVELISRIEQHFKVTLPDRVFVEVESPRDLLRSIAVCRAKSKPSLQNRWLNGLLARWRNYPTMHQL